MFKNIKDLHPSNIEFILFIFFVLKWDKSKDKIDSQFLNIFSILSTNLVSKLEISKDTSDLQS